MRILPFFSCITILTAILYLSVSNHMGLAAEHQGAATTDNRIIHHIAFTQPSSPEERAAVKALVADWKNLPHEGVSDNWNKPEFLKKVQFTSAAIDLNRDAQKEVRVRLVLHEKDTYMCLHQNCLSFLMELKNGKWERGNQESYLNMMLGETIDALDQYNEGYASFQTPCKTPLSRISGKEYGYRYNYGSSFYSPEIIEFKRKKPQVSLKSAPPDGTGKVLHHLTLQEKTTPATQAAVTAFLEWWSTRDMGALEGIWHDPNFLSKIKITSAAVDLNRDNVEEVVIRLSTDDDDLMICRTFWKVTACNTYIMQLENGRWKIMGDRPVSSIAKIDVLDSYHHGYADLSTHGMIYRYNGRYFTAYIEK